MEEKRSEERGQLVGKLTVRKESNSRTLATSSSVAALTCYTVNEASFSTIIYCHVKTTTAMFADVKRTKIFVILYEQYFYNISAYTTQINSLSIFCSSSFEVSRV